MEVCVGIWNIRGMNQEKKQKEMKFFISEHNLNIYAILESHLREDKIDSICLKVFNNWNHYSNSCICNGGTRIILGWNPSQVSIMVLEFI